MPIIKDNKNLFTLDNNNSNIKRRWRQYLRLPVVVGYKQINVENEKLTLFRLKKLEKLLIQLFKTWEEDIFQQLVIR